MVDDGLLVVLTALDSFSFNTIVKDLNEIGASLKSLQSTVDLIKKNPVIFWFWLLSYIYNDPVLIIP